MATVELHHGALTECRRPSTAVDAPGVEAQTIARRVRAAGSSFYWAIGLLPAPRRHSMYALYAFCREVNDIAGSETTSSLKRALLAAWRSEIALLYAGRPRHHVTRALQEAVQQYGLRCDDFLAVIDGMEMDSRRDIRAPSLAELDLYCARVAVAVGLLSMRILGVTTPAGERVAGALGRAIRLTNILRDLTEDGARHRLYLPRELLLAHGIVATMPSYVLAQPALPAVCQDLARLAENHYEAAAAAIAACPRGSMRPAAAMLGLNRALLRRLVARGWGRLDEKVRLPAWEKAALVLCHGLIGP
jgi:presqualene diphosphate synthase